jgi:endonuclease/exonuclease/phosphatase family metal-dependent hydrolase
MHILKSPYPVIVCGDFNDSPVSYTYQKISANLKDAFLESGTGLGSTYSGRFPSYRIDYILHNPQLSCYQYANPKMGLSDHQPVICKMYKRKK